MPDYELPTSSRTHLSWQTPIPISITSDRRVRFFRSMVVIAPDGCTAGSLDLPEEAGGQPVARHGHNGRAAKRLPPILSASSLLSIANTADARLARIF
jgi:hypothetical protein